MLALTANHADRQEALHDAVSRLATDLLEDRKPEDEAVGLLLLVVIDAALSGDRIILAAAGEAISRLESYLGGGGAWIDQLGGRFWVIGELAGLSDFLLEVEERIASSGPR